MSGRANIDLTSKGVLVTGGGSGICLAFVQYLYKAGCNVLICDLKLHREAKVWLQTIDNDAQASPRISFRKTDVTDWKQLEETFVAYQREFGGVPDIVCPGAGVYEPSVNNFWNDTDSSTYLILRINLEHPIKLARLAIRKWLQHPTPPTDLPPTIVMISSTGAQTSSIITPLYLATKAGISSFTRSMGAELYKHTGIRCVAIAPGPTMSPLFFDHEQALKFVDLEKDKLASTDEVASAMMGLLTQREKFGPGTVLEITHSDRWRAVRVLDDPGPAGDGASRREQGVVDVLKEIERDRGGPAKL